MREMMESIGDDDILREARRVLPLLAERDSYLAAGEAGPGTETIFAVCCEGSKRRVAQPVTSGAVEVFLERGWIAGQKSRLAITDAGSAWLRRQSVATEPFRQQHQLRAQATRVVAGARRPVVVNDGESPLGWLRRRKDKLGAPLITEYQFQAGERLRADFTRARMMPRVTANWESAAPSRRARRTPQASNSIGDGALAAKQRVNKALHAVGPELAGILIDVCCHLQGLAEAEQNSGWPQRSGKVILQIALTRLARHYGMVSETELAKPIRHRLRHWGTEDFKPSLDTWR